MTPDRPRFGDAYAADYIDENVLVMGHDPAVTVQDGEQHGEAVGV